jgi:pSer/pThr/pTyr-binding forkhead associated (FHA) protein
MDLGSLNGTLLNGEPISVAGRTRGHAYRLSSDDILQLGSHTKVKVSTFPRDLLQPSFGSLLATTVPRSLVMPKARIPSFNSLLSPKVRHCVWLCPVVVSLVDEQPSSGA